MNVTSLTRGFVRIERDSRTFLGVATGLRGGSFAVRKLSQGTNVHGWIIHDGSVERWNTGGLTEHSGSVYVYGPYMSGYPLRDAIEGDTETALDALERVATALQTAEQHDIVPSALHLRGVLLLDDGGVLLLPREVVELIREQQDEDSLREEFDYLNHPDERGPGNISFALAALSYRVIAGSWPFDLKDEADRHTMVREQSLLEPSLVYPEIRKDISDLLYQTLSSEHVPGFDEWASLLHEWRTDGVKREISDEERTRILAAAEQKRKQLFQQFTRREKVRKHWKQALVVIVAVIVVGTIPGTMISNRLEPPKTAGFTAEEVVRAFYEAQNDLDHELMEDATADGAGAERIREVVNLFVISRMRMSVEFDSGIVDAGEWDAEGRPPISEGSWLYGISDLSIEPVETQRQDERAFRVIAERWRLDQSPDDAEEVATEEDLTSHSEISGVRQEELVRLRQEEDEWVIYSMESVSEEPLDYEIEFEESEEQPVAP
ncbi:MAG: hypothetical protein ACLFM0_00915 [Spirochaetales bacterium]